jgi:hypothetical protein
MVASRRRDLLRGVVVRVLSFVLLVVVSAWYVLLPGCSGSVVG